MLRNQSTTFQLSFNTENKTVSLSKSGQLCLVANFFRDLADGTTLLSHFSYQTAERNLVPVLANMLSQETSQQSPNSKLLCDAGEYEEELQHNDQYHSNKIDRFMLRETQAYPTSSVSLPNDVSITDFDNAEVTSEKKYEMIELLKQTYWGKDANEAYVNAALKISNFAIAKDKDQKIIGLVRYVTNGDFAYISDMVVDQSWRRKGIATALLHKTCEQIEANGCAYTALFSAREGDGLDAANSLYTGKFGFNNYNEQHQHKIFFRYVRYQPEPVLTPAINSGLTFTGISGRKIPDPSEEPAPATLRKGT